MKRRMTFTVPDTPAGINDLHISADHNPKDVNIISDAGKDCVLRRNGAQIDLVSEGDPKWAPNDRIRLEFVYEENCNDGYEINWTKDGVPV